MYVQKFEADSMSEALKEIKRELGPDAIILKTTSNTGLKGAFKKSKVEITAAISEKSYVKKARVDAVLDKEQKDELYSSSASFISNMIDQHDAGTSDKSIYQVKEGSNQSYGGMSLNKSVKTVRDIGQKIKTGLDEFLSLGATGNNSSDAPFESVISDEPVVNVPLASTASENEIHGVYKKKLQELEEKVYRLSKSVEKYEKQDPKGLLQLRTTLRSFDISEQYITDVCKKAVFDLSEEELANDSTVFEFALKEMLGAISVGMPLFSSQEIGNNPAITVLIGGNGSGQTSMTHKLAALKDSSVIIRNRNRDERAKFTEKMFGMEVINTSSIAAIVAETRKAVEAGKFVFIDYKSSAQEASEGKNFINSLRRSFHNVEVLTCISAINSEIYNRKNINEYRSVSDGLVVSKLDICLNFGTIFNLAEKNRELPLKFFGTGEVVPEDIEAATAERILAGIFQF